MHPQYEPYWSNYLRQFALPFEHFQNIPGETTKFCVIVEPRCSELLPLVIKNFMYLLQKKGWGLIVFHGTTNEKFIKDHLRDWKNIVHVRINIENLSVSQYNDLYCSPSFWELLKTFGCTHALTFEIDTLLLKDDIDTFLEYDYVGAPWFAKWLDMLEVGNGGLSLRNVDRMLSITKTCPRYSGLENNDIYFSYWCLQKGYRVPSIDIAKTFSVETIYYKDPSGMHKPHIDKFPGKESYIRLVSKRHTV